MTKITIMALTSSRKLDGKTGWTAKTPDRKNKTMKRSKMAYAILTSSLLQIDSFRKSKSKYRHHSC